MTPMQLAQLAQVFGVVGLLSAAVCALVFNWVYPKSTLNTLVRSAIEAKQRELDVVTDAKDKEIARLQTIVEELTHSRDTMRELLLRNTGSQNIQASVVADAMSAMTDLAKKVLAAPPTPALGAGAP